MATWTAQMGYPVVTLAQTGQTVVASQKRFLLDETDNSTSKFTSPYGWVPLGRPTTWGTYGGQLFRLAIFLSVSGIIVLRSNTILWYLWQFTFSECNWKKTLYRWYMCHVPASCRTAVMIKPLSTYQKSTFPAGLMLSWVPNTESGSSNASYIMSTDNGDT